MTKITALITSYNEEPNIARAIESVLWADEVIVVDSYSNDGTVDIIRSFPQVRLIQHEYESAGIQKNWAMQHCTHNWIFVLDSDEVVSNKLKEEILKNAADPGKYHAFWIPRINYFLGKPVKYAFGGDKVIRLFRKDTCRYKPLAVHAEVITDEPVGKFREYIIHYSYRGSEHFLEKTERYARWSAKDHNPNTGRITAFHLFIKPAFRFIKHYFINGGILDGKVGYIVSSIMAWGVFLRYYNMMEMRMVEREGVRFGGKDKA